MTINSLHPTHSTAARLGGRATGVLAVRIAATLATLSAVAAWPLAVVASPQSGAWCRQERCLTYPFTDARYVPHDFWWMYPATLAVLSFAVVLALIEPHVAPHRRTASRLASLAATTGAMLLAATYTLQLLTTPRPEGRGFSASRPGVPVSSATAPGRTRNG